MRVSIPLNSFARRIAACESFDLCEVEKYGSATKSWGRKESLGTFVLVMTKFLSLWLRQFAPQTSSASLEETASLEEPFRCQKIFQRKTTRYSDTKIKNPDPACNIYGQPRLNARANHSDPRGNRHVPLLPREERDGSSALKSMLYRYVTRVVLMSRSSTKKQT